MAQTKNQTPQTQLEAVSRYRDKQKDAGYKSTAFRINPQVAAALDYLRQNRRGGFNLTQAVQELILTEAAKEGFKVDEQATT